MTTIKRRISVGELLGSIKERRKIAEEKSGQPVVRIVGMAFAVSVSDKENDKGEAQRSVKFKGSAKATNLLTGEVVNTTNTFLPGAASDMLEEAIAVAEKGSVINYAFDVALVEDENSAVGYVYQVTALLKNDEKSDPLAAIEAQLAAPALQLADKAAKKVA